MQDLQPNTTLQGGKYKIMRVCWGKGALPVLTSQTKSLAMHIGLLGDKTMGNDYG